MDAMDATPRLQDSARSMQTMDALHSISVKKYPVLRPGSPFFTGKSGFGVVGIGFGMARGGGKIG